MESARSSFGLTDSTIRESSLESAISSASLESLSEPPSQKRRRTNVNVASAFVPSLDPATAQKFNDLWNDGNLIMV
ncbi:hypothetical protein [Microscilla marina]|uniref:hypothetical protein n=1 Tax=Microscilla marina TaxID=1027 RepID=UPI0012F93ED6|nr:hypothetical protein [Microscilla marina]